MTLMLKYAAALKRVEKAELGVQAAVERRQAALKERDRVLADAYADGMSLRAIAEETGLSFGHVRRLLADLEVERRPRSVEGTPHPRARRPKVDEGETERSETRARRPKPETADNGVEA